MMMVMCMQSLMEIIDLLQMYATITRDRMTKTEEDSIESLPSFTTAIDDGSSTRQATPDDVQSEVVSMPPVPSSARTAAMVSKNTEVALLSPSSALHASWNDRGHVAFSPVTAARVMSSHDDVTKAYPPRGPVLLNNDRPGLNDTRFALRKFGTASTSTRFPNKLSSVGGGGGETRLLCASVRRSSYDCEVTLQAVSDWLDANGLGMDDVWSALLRAGLVINLDECSPNWFADPLSVLKSMMINIGKTCPFGRLTNAADNIDIIQPGRLSDAGHGDLAGYGKPAGYGEFACYNMLVSLGEPVGYGEPVGCGEPPAVIGTWDSCGFSSEFGLMRSMPPADLREATSAGETKDRPSTRTERQPEIDDYLRFLELAVWEELSFSEWFSSYSPDDVETSERSAGEPSVDEVYDDPSSCSTEPSENDDDDDESAGTDKEFDVVRNGAGPDDGVKEWWSVVDEVDFDDFEIGETHSLPSADSLESTRVAPSPGLAEDDDDLEIEEHMWYIHQEEELLNDLRTIGKGHGLPPPRNTR